ncbi:MAG: SGNH/GDSL hydrolase family protein [Anaerolineae bacterium]|nr:SGNH/GDSL hydrolase family protein [Anaerolineae bacterium]MDW8172116.1 SGNH/GDSL hydrolase family protein [Anaerolineae bacterium]
MRLVFLGDSLTWGGYGGNWVSEVARRLPKVQVVNAGVGGDTVVNLQRRLPGVLDEHKPSAMFVMVGGNDAVSYTMPETRPYYRNSKGIKPDGFVSPQAFASTYRELLSELLLHHVQPLVGLPPTEYNAALVEARRQYNQLAQEVAQSFNVPVLDLALPFMPLRPIEREPVTMAYIREIGQRSASGWRDFETERARYGYTYTFDGMHLLPQTALRFAELIVSFLRQHLPDLD